MPPLPHLASSSPGFPLNLPAPACLAPCFCSPFSLASHHHWGLLSADLACTSLTFPSPPHSRELLSAGNKVRAGVRDMDAAEANLKIAVGVDSTLRRCGGTTPGWALAKALGLAGQPFQLIPSVKRNLLA